MTDPPPGSRFFASFRDPAGRLCRLDGRILRLVGRAEAGEIRAFLASDLSHTLTSRRWLIPSTELPPRALADLTNAHPDLGVLIAESATGMVIEHEAIPFPSYPHEWPAEMLHAAGELTLDLALELLPYGLGLKDATPYNVQFRGPAPVFVDVLSIERRRPGDRVWLPYAQFGRTFLLPLLLWQRKGVPPCESLASRRDGVEPEAAVRHFGPLDRLRPPVLTLATLPAKLSGRSTAPPPAPQGGDPEKAAYVLGAVLRQLRRTLTRLTPRAPRSQWTSYHDSRAHYSEEGAAAKSEFVQRAVSTLRPTRVLDVGCNVGHFSELAARAGSSVVAIDADPAVVGAAWRRLGQTSLDVLPLVVNLARPTPALGWRNREYPAFLDRAAGRFDLVLMLAVLHHLVVTDRHPAGRDRYAGGGSDRGRGHCRVHRSPGPDVQADRARPGRAPRGTYAGVVRTVVPRALRRRALRAAVEFRTTTLPASQAAPVSGGPAGFRVAVRYGEDWTAGGPFSNSATRSLPPGVSATGKLAMTRRSGYTARTSWMIDPS